MNPSWVLGTFLPSFVGGGGHVIFIQNALPDASIHSHTFSLHVSQSFEDGTVCGGEI